jgi:hypothetical protein
MTAIYLNLLSSTPARRVLRGSVGTLRRALDDLVSRQLLQTTTRLQEAMATAKQRAPRQSRNTESAAATRRILRRPDDAILDASIPAYFIGRNHHGLWIARDESGRNGGLFLLKSSAIRFANRATRPTGCAVILTDERFELDVPNRGNPLLGWSAAWKRSG